MTLPPAAPQPSPSGPGAGAWNRSVRERLFEQRVVFLWGPLEDHVANQVAAELMTLDATGDEPIQLHIDSGGGTLDAALSLIDVIDLLGVELQATCVGQAFGPALGPLAVAPVRRATPHARFRLTEPSVDANGTARDLEAWVKDHQRRLGQFCERLAEAVHRPADAVAEDLRSGRFLDADEARRYGIIDEVCGPDARVYPLNPRPLGFRRDP